MLGVRRVAALFGVRVLDRLQASVSTRPPTNRANWAMPIIDGEPVRRASNMLTQTGFLDQGVDYRGL